MCLMRLIDGLLIGQYKIFASFYPFGRLEKEPRSS